MSRLAGADVFAPHKIALVHVISRVVQRCFLLGDDPETGKNFVHERASSQMNPDHDRGSSGQANERGQFSSGRPGDGRPGDTHPRRGRGRRGRGTPIRCRY